MSVNDMAFDSDQRSTTTLLLRSLKHFVQGIPMGAGAGLLSGLIAASDLLRDGQLFDASDWIRLTLEYSALAGLASGGLWDLSHQVRSWLDRRQQVRPEPLWDFEVDGPSTGAPAAPLRVQR